MSFLTGTITLTTDDKLIYETPLLPMTKIISMDEDNVLMKTPDVIGGTCLLPPIEAKIAEIDGNLAQFEAIYADHLSAPFQHEFMSALIAYLYRGGHIIIFLSELGYTNTLKVFIGLIWQLYGLHIGLIGSQDPIEGSCFYDEKCIPMWLNDIYMANVLSPFEFLAMYPLDAAFTNKFIMKKLILEIRPYGAKTVNEKIEYIMHLHKLLHKNPNVRPAVSNILEKGLE